MHGLITWNLRASILIRETRLHNPKLSERHIFARRGCTPLLGACQRLINGWMSYAPVFQEYGVVRLSDNSVFSLLRCANESSTVHILSYKYTILYIIILCIYYRALRKINKKVSFDQPNTYTSGGNRNSFGLRSILKLRVIDDGVAKWRNHDVHCSTKAFSSQTKERQAP